MRRDNLTLAAGAYKCVLAVSLVCFPLVSLAGQISGRVVGGCAGSMIVSDSTTGQPVIEIEVQRNKFYQAYLQPGDYKVKMSCNSIDRMGTIQVRNGPQNLEIKLN
jgi:glutamine amidotransferase PdxT